MARHIPHVTPLIDIRNTDFGKAYEQGLWWSMFGGREGDGLLDDRYLVDNLKTFAAHGWFTGEPHSWLSHIGFLIGMLHGAVLVPRTGDLRPGVTTLVIFTSKDCRRG